MNDEVKYNKSPLTSLTKGIINSSEGKKRKLT
jgi:hypothetical protein